MKAKCILGEGNESVTLLIRHTFRPVSCGLSRAVRAIRFFLLLDQLGRLS